MRRHHGSEAKIERELPSLLAFVCPIHDEMDRPWRLAESLQQLAAFRRVMRLARRQRERYGRSSIRGNHMNLGGPPCARPADGLWAVFLEPRSRPDAL